MSHFPNSIWKKKKLLLRLTEICRLQAFIYRRTNKKKLLSDSSKKKKSCWLRHSNGFFLISSSFFQWQLPTIASREKKFSPSSSTRERKTKQINLLFFSARSGFALSPSLPDIMHIRFALNSNNYYDWSKGKTGFSRLSDAHRWCWWWSGKNNVYDSHTALALNFVCMNWNEKTSFWLAAVFSFSWRRPFETRFVIFFSSNFHFLVPIVCVPRETEKKKNDLVFFHIRPKRSSTAIAGIFIQMPLKWARIFFAVFVIRVCIFFHRWNYIQIEHHH